MGHRLDAWYSGSEQYAQWRRDLGEQAGWVGDLEFGAAVRDNVAVVPVQDPAAWANRRLDLPDSDWCVTGIRYRGLDVNKPFVDVIASSLPLTTDALAAISAAVAAEYAEFTPLALRVEVPDPDTAVAAVLDDQRFADASVDQYVIAGLVSQLHTRRKSAHINRIELVSVEPEACIDDIADMYHQLGQQRPDLPLWAHPATADELTACAREDLLFRVLVEGNEAGVVAACRDDDHGLRGFQIQELVLDAAHREQGFAPAVLQRLIDLLPAQTGDTLWGTINHDNEPSWRNATSIGREVISGYIWITPAKLAGTTVSRTKLKRADTLYSNIRSTIVGAWNHNPHHLMDRLTLQLPAQ